MTSNVRFEDYWLSLVCNHLVFFLWSHLLLSLMTVRCWYSISQYGISFLRVLLLSRHLVFLSFKDRCSLMPKHSRGIPWVSRPKEFPIPLGMVAWRIISISQPYTCRPALCSCLCTWCENICRFLTTVWRKVSAVWREDPSMQRKDRRS